MRWGGPEGWVIVEAEEQSEWDWVGRAELGALGNLLPVWVVLSLPRGAAERRTKWCSAPSFLPILEGRADRLARTHLY